MPRKRKTFDDLLNATRRTYDDIAEASGVGRHSMYRLRMGMVAKPWRRTVQARADELGLPFDVVRDAIQASRDEAENA